MAWRSNGTTNAEMVEALWKNGHLKQEAVRDAFLAIDRRWFIPRSIPESYAAAFRDSPQQIGYNVTNSAPHMLCIMTEIVVDHAGGTLNGKKILDIGSGSGMLTTVFATGNYYVKFGTLLLFGKRGATKRETRTYIKKSRRSAPKEKDAYRRQAADGQDDCA